MKVPQLVPWIGEEEYKALASCFENNWITEGPKTKEFEERLLALTGAKYGVFAPNGTLAIYLGCRALGIGSDDEVIVPDFTFIASATAVEMTGAMPVFIDVNKKNFQIDLSDADRLINKHTRAIMPVHIYGASVDMEPVLKFARRYKLKVIEDAAEAIGVYRNGVHAGTFGDVGCFSFFADKTITTGEGGFVVTDNKEIYESLLYLRNQGRIDRGSFIHPEIGYNFRTTDFHSALGLIQLRKLKKIIKRKRTNLESYKKLLNGVAEVTFFEPDEGSEWVPFRVPILAKQAHDLMNFLAEKDIMPRGFFYPLHRQPAFFYLKSEGRDPRLYDDSNFPNSIYGYEHGVCLPVFPTLTPEQIGYVCDTIKEFYGGKRNLFYKYYDVLFKDKNYAGETDQIFKISNHYGLGKAKKVLEIGCGTGNHTLHLMKGGIKKLIAIDTDLKMVEISQNKIKRSGKKNVRVFHTRVEELGEKGFDLSLALFNVVNYLSDERELTSFMKGVADALLSGGVFVFDCWNGVAAIKDPPGAKETSVKNAGETVSCLLTSETDLFNQVTTLNYNIKVTRGEEVTQSSFSFNQTLWTPMQIKSAVSRAGLEIVSVSPLGQVDQSAAETDWKIMFCVRKPR